MCRMTEFNSWITGLGLGFCTEANATVGVGVEKSLAVRCEATARWGKGGLSTEADNGKDKP